MPSSRRTSHALTQNYPRSTVSHCHAYGTSGTTKPTNNNRGTTTMETVMSRIGRLLGMRMHNPTRPVCPVPQSTEAVPSNTDTFEVVAVSKKKKSRKHNVLLKPKYMKLNESIDTVKKLRSEGLTYRLIGEHLKMSKQRVYQIIQGGRSQGGPLRGYRSAQVGQLRSQVLHRPLPVARCQTT